MPESSVSNFFHHRKFRAARAVFVTFLIAIPLYVFSNFEKFVKDETPYQWLTEKGWWSMSGVKFGAGWLLGSFALSLAVYPLFSAAAWLTDRWKSSSLKVAYEDEPPYTDDSGPSPLGFYYCNRRIGITTPVDGKVTVRVPIVKLENGQIRSNVFLRPTDNQPEEVDAGDPAYWRVAQWNTSENSIKLVHKGKESYYLGRKSQFEIAVKCAAIVTRKVVTVWIEDRRLGFQIDEIGQGPALAEVAHGLDKLPGKTEQTDAKLAGKIICLNTTTTINDEGEYIGLDCFFTMFVNIWNDASGTTVTGFRFEVIWNGKDYPSIRKRGLDKYHVKYTLPSDNPWESKYETEFRVLEDFPMDVEITSTNNKRGWCGSLLEEFHWKLE